MSLRRNDILLLACGVAVLVTFRLVDHLPNFTPIAAVAIMGGALLRNWKLAAFFPMAAMLLSDLALQMMGKVGFHSTMLYVYGAFLASVFLGRALLRRRFHPFGVLGTGLASSAVFFLTTNLGTWLHEGLYAPTLAGLATCYGMALPFFRYELLGNLFYLAVFYAVTVAARQHQLRRAAA